MIRRLSKIILFLLILCASLTTVDAQSAYYGKIKKYSNLYRLSSNHSAILAWLPENTVVFVTSDVVVNGFVPIIYIESGVEGYVYRNVIDFTDRVTETPNVAIAKTVLQRTDSVIITVKNNTTRTLTLKIDNINHTIVSGDENRIVLALGMHRYILFGPKFLPLVGAETFDREQKFTWKISAMQLY